MKKIEDMIVAELRTFAKKNKIDLGEATRKDDIKLAIDAHLEEKEALRIAKEEARLAQEKLDAELADKKIEEARLKQEAVDSELAKKELKDGFDSYITYEDDNDESNDLTKAKEVNDDIKPESEVDTDEEEEIEKIVLNSDDILSLNEDNLVEIFALKSFTLKTSKHEDGITLDKNHTYSIDLEELKPMYKKLYRWSIIKHVKLLTKK